MARPHIEFIQSQSLPWAEDLRFGLGTGVRVKVLSEDSVNGAASVLVRYPAGWTAAAHPKGADEEFIVLGGALETDGYTFGHLGYGRWPAGFHAPLRRTTKETVILTFFSSNIRASPPAEFDPRALVLGIDGYSIPYTGNFHPQFPPGAGRKVLFTHPDTGETSWLLGTLPVRWAERSEVHPYVEEMYLLSGESHGDRGVMRPGAYFWRPGGVPHGPYGTLSGNLYFFRTQGGPLITNYVEPERPFQWNPAYRPRLPDEMAGLAREAGGAPKPW